MRIEYQNKVLLTAGAFKAELNQKTGEVRLSFIQEAGTVHHEIQLFVTGPDMMQLLVALSTGLQELLSPHSKIIH